MGVDKGTLTYGVGSNLNQRQKCFQLLSPFCERVYISCQADQVELESDPQHLNLHIILDAYKNQGPASGILSAHLKYPEVAWLVLACDFPFADHNSIQVLIDARNSMKSATHYSHKEGSVEPLFAIWEIQALKKLLLGGKTEYQDRKIMSGLEPSQTARSFGNTSSNVEFKANSPSLREALDGLPQYPRVFPRIRFQS